MQELVFQQRVISKKEKNKFRFIVIIFVKKMEILPTFSRKMHSDAQEWTLYS